MLFVLSLAAGCPTVWECIGFQGRERKINIPQEIGTKYCQFGIHLLNDHNGNRVQSIEHSCHKESERINIKIIQEWVAGKGKNPVNWKTLTEVLHDIELRALASEIEAVKLVKTL